MKRFLGIVLVIILVCVNTMLAQTPPIQWQSSYGGSDRDYGYFIQQTADSGFITIGTTYSTDGQVTGNHGYGDLWVTKLTATGALTWEKCLGSAFEDQGRCIQQTNDGGYILTGWVATPFPSGDVTKTLGFADAWVVKLDDTGKIIWQQSYGGSQGDGGNRIQQTFDGGYIIAGSTNSTDSEVTGFHGGTGTDFWVFKINDTGKLIWGKCYGGTKNDVATSIQQTPDSGYIIAGITASNDGDITYYHGGSYDCWVVKINDTGGLQWQRTYGGSGDDEANSISLTKEGGYITTGNSNSNDGDVSGNFGDYDFWTLKLNDTGGITWAKCYGGSSTDYGSYIQQTTDSGYIMIGMSLSSDFEVTNNYGNFDIWVVKTDPSGNIQWQKNLGGDSIDEGYCITQTFDGNYATIGWSRSLDHDVTSNHGTADVWVVKLGATIPNVISKIEINDNIQVYPNPTNGILNIKLPENYINAKIIVRDIIDREIPINSSTGSERTINVQDFYPGIYTLMIINNEGKNVFKILKENNK